MASSVAYADKFPVYEGGVTQVVPGLTCTELWLSSTATKSLIVGGVTAILYLLGPIPKISAKLSGLLTAGFSGFLTTYVGDGKYPACVIRFNYFKKNQFSLQLENGQPFFWLDMEV